MPIARFQMPDGRVARFEVPEGTTPEQAQAQMEAHFNEPSAPAEKPSKPYMPADMVKDVGGGLLRGAGSIGSTIMRALPNALGGDTAQENEQRRARLDENARNLLGSDTDSWGYKGGKLAGELAGTAGIGGMAAKALPAGSALASALRSAGMTTGAAPVGFAAKAGDMAIRTGAGAAVGGASAAATGDSAGTGAVIGGMLPGAFKAAGAAGGYAGDVLSSLVKPLFAKGQTEMAADLMQKFATNKNNAAQALTDFKEVVPGSVPLASAASGDIGLANLTRTLQNASKDFAGDLQTRQWQQNAARTTEIENIAGNVGKLGHAKAGRDAATEAMRDDVLARAGNLGSQQVLQGLDFMLANPDSAGKLSQAALSGVKSQIERASQNGEISARALYAIRKDINDTLSGKLAGEAGNLRYASGELIGAKNLIDDAIEAASKRTNPAAKSVQQPPAQNGFPQIGGVPRLAAPQNQVGFPRAPMGNEPLRLGGAEPTGWRDYLAKYTEMSKPINQMEALQDVMKRVQNGTVDNQGNLIMSGAKLNNILKNETEDLKKLLTPEQLQSLRNLAGDLNASTLGMTAGKAVGSNTMQNASQDRLLTALLGDKVGGSTPSKMLLGNLLKLPYIRANENVMDKIGAGLLDPKEAARLLDYKKNPNKLAELLSSPEAQQLMYRLAPISGQ